jgi:hypothetical protein
MTLVTDCVRSEAREPGPEHQADRGAEREALLAAARPAIEACMAGAGAPLNLVIALGIDERGEIAHVKSDAEPLNHPASRCVERGILTAAHFAPSDRRTFIRVRLQLVPPR